MKLYSYWRSTAAYRVRIALNLKGLSADVAPIHAAGLTSCVKANLLVELVSSKKEGRITTVARSGHAKVMNEERK